MMYKLINEFEAKMAVIDPVTNLISVGNENEVKSMLSHLIDFLKSKHITAFFTNLSHGTTLEQTEFGISSLMDTWILLRDIESSGERNRGLYVLKSRGMAHSNQIREFLLSDKGANLLDVYSGPEGVLTGSARVALEAQEKAREIARNQEIERRKRDLERQRTALESHIAALRADFESKEEEMMTLIRQEQQKEETLSEEKQEMMRLRRGDIDTKTINSGRRE